MISLNYDQVALLPPELLSYIVVQEHDRAFILVFPLNKIFHSTCMPNFVPGVLSYNYLYLIVGYEKLFVKGGKILDRR
jgi:hypothetical protein